MSMMDDIEVMEKFRREHKGQETYEFAPMNVLANQALYSHEEMTRIEEQLVKHMKEEREIRKKLNRFRKSFHHHSKAFKVLVRERERELREQSERGE